MPTSYLSSAVRRAGLGLVALFFLLSPPLLSQASATKTLPEDGAVVDKPVRTIRIWFDSAPDVDKTELSIEGPSEGLTVQGAHTMGEDDLMARLSGPMPDGEYTVHWKTIDGDGNESAGSYTFTVKRGGNS